MKRFYVEKMKEFVESNVATNYGSYITSCDGKCGISKLKIQKSKMLLTVKKTF